MTKLDFPDTPSTGQLFGSSGTTWRWDGTRWSSTAGVAGEKGTLGLTILSAGVTGIVGSGVVVMSVACNLVAGRTYRVSTTLQVGSTVGGDQAAVLITDSAGAQLQGQVWGLPTANVTVPMSLDHIFTSPVTMAYTFKTVVYRNVGSGTLSVAAAANYKSTLLVEDITYEAGSGGTPQTTPGYEWLYQEVQNVVAVTSTTAATANVVINPNRLINYDGTAVWVEVFSPSIQTNGGATGGVQIFVNVWRDSTDLGFMGQMINPKDGTLGMTFYAKRKMIPAIGSGNIHVRSWVSATQGSFCGGNGAANSYPPAFIRITKA